MLSYGLDIIVARMNSHRLLLPTKGLPMTGPGNTQTQMGEKIMGPCHDFIAGKAVFSGVATGELLMQGVGGEVASHLHSC